MMNPAPPRRGSFSTREVLSLVIGFTLMGVVIARMWARYQANESRSEPVQETAYDDRTAEDLNQEARDRSGIWEQFKNGLGSRDWEDPDSPYGKVDKDMNRVRVALESFYVDWNYYPPERPLADLLGDTATLEKAGMTDWTTIEPGQRETTYPIDGPPAGIVRPIGYLQEDYLQDRFSPIDRRDPPGSRAPFIYRTNNRKYVLISAGPDGDYDADPTYNGGPFAEAPGGWTREYVARVVYDPVNGSKSGGDIIYMGRGKIGPSAFPSEEELRGVAGK